jgi:hypothetical protein
MFLAEPKRLFLAELLEEEAGDDDRCLMGDKEHSAAGVLAAKRVS